jgi:transcriptional regulator with XRE-family HTH domain
MNDALSRVKQHGVANTVIGDLDAAKMPKMKEIKDLLREAREALKLSQDQLSERSGIDRPRISAVENGRNKATGFELRQAYARGFGVPVDLLADYLDGRVELSALIDSALSGQVAERANDEDDPIEERAQAIIVLRGAGMPEAVLLALRRQSAKGVRERTVEEWCTVGKELFKLQLEQKREIEAMMAEPPRVSAAEKAKAQSGKRR